MEPWKHPQPVGTKPRANIVGLSLFERQFESQRMGSLGIPSSRTVRGYSLIQKEPEPHQEIRRWGLEMTTHIRAGRSLPRSMSPPASAGGGGGNYIFVQAFIDQADGATWTGLVAYSEPIRVA